MNFYIIGETAKETLELLRRVDNGYELTEDEMRNLKEITGANFSELDLEKLPESIGKLSQLTELDISENRLTSLPETIGNLSHLTKLKLFANNLSSLPENISALSQLTELDISCNQLTRLPESIGALSQLTKLNVSINELTSIPNSIRTLFQLTKLDISINSLARFPESICALSQLTQLDISNNKLTSLSNSIGKLSQLTILNASQNRLTNCSENISALSQLTKLNISKNQLIRLPENIGALSRLEKLNVSSNQLDSLPESISTLFQLVNLDVSRNHLTRLPEGIGSLSRLTELKIYSNRLTSLPESVGMLSQLTELNVFSNRLTNLPESIGELFHLTKLNGHHNQLTSLPKSIGTLSQLTELHMSNNQLTNLPESIGKLSQLTNLNVSDNQLTNFPESIGELSQLTKLNVFGNQLTNLSESIGKLSHLTELNVSGNQLTNLPESIGELSQLTRLKVSGNQLTNFPESIGKLSQLAELNVSGNQLHDLPENISTLFQLVKLDASYNQLTSLPDSIGALSQLTELKVFSNQLDRLPDSISMLSQFTKLNVSNNQLTNLPESVGKLSQLVELNVSGNQLQCLPESISTLFQLVKLDASNNPLVSLPDSIGALSQLTELNIHKIGLQEVPYGIRQLSKLKSLDLGYNPLKMLPNWLGEMTELHKIDLSSLHLISIPQSLLKLNIPFLDDIDDLDKDDSKYIYLENSDLSIQPISLFIQSRDKSPRFQKSRKLIEEYFETPKVHVREAKVIFLGDGKAGKTYTIQRLLHNCHKGDYPTKETHGILIEDLYAEKDGESYKIRVWDFGGQDIMHEMHRCFLTDRTCYVVMVDTRVNKQTWRARYWLRTVQSIAPKAPVLLLVNEVSSGRNCDLDYSSLKQEFLNLVGVEYCSSKDADDDQFRQRVEDAIFRQALDMDSCKMELPQSWESVRQNLLSLRSGMEQEQKKTYYIDRQDFHNLCDQYAVPADDGLRAWLLTWFNDLGICFSYHLGEDGQERSADYKILDPMWLTSAVYKIIWEKKQTDDGLIAQSEICRILEKPGSAAMKKDGIPCLEDVSYNAQECGYVLDIMRMFRISYPANPHTEFIPALCQSNSNLDPMPKCWRQHAACRFRYAFLPETVLHRLMIFCFANLRPGKRWRKGFWLECEFQGLSAVIRSGGPDSEENELQIDVYAQNDEFEAWMWLQPLCQQLAQINSTLSLKAEVFALAENDDEEKWFSLDSIWYWKNRGVPNLQGERNLFPIQPLMDLIYGKYFPDMEKKLSNKSDGSQIIQTAAFPSIITAIVADLTKLDISSPLEEQSGKILDAIEELKRSIEDNTAALQENTWTQQKSNDLLGAIRDGKIQLPPEVMDALVEAFRQSDKLDLQTAEQKLKGLSRKDKGQWLRDFLGDAANFVTVAPVLFTLGKDYGPTLLRLIATLALTTVGC